MVIFADDGLDELSVTVAVDGHRAAAATASDYELTHAGGSTRPISGSRGATLAELSGGDAAFNAAAIRPCSTASAARTATSASSTRRPPWSWSGMAADLGGGS